jgi:hypothetical protein
MVHFTVSGTLTGADPETRKNGVLADIVDSLARGYAEGWILTAMSESRRVSGRSLTN